MIILLLQIVRKLMNDARLVLKSSFTLNLVDRRMQLNFVFAYHLLTLTLVPCLQGRPAGDPENKKSIHVLSKLIRMMMISAGAC